MKTIVIGLPFILIATFSPSLAAAWMSANRFGGSTTHTYGSTTHTNAYGGSTSHAYGVGTAHTNMYGGTTAHGWYGGTAHTYPSGGAAYYHPPAAYPAYRPPYPVYPYHPPVAVPYYSSSCSGCAVAAGAIAGVATGVAVASASSAAATTSAYNAGVAAGSASTAAAISGDVVLLPTSSTTYVMGVNYAAIPGGCATPTVSGQSYYLCGNTWFQPFYGANGVYYKVVPTP